MDKDSRKVPARVGGGYSLGEKEGEAKHALTYAELPSHAHDVNTTVNARVYTGTTKGTIWAPGQFYVQGDGSYTGDRDNQQFITAYAGDGRPHNNMPPYQVVNIWEKISD